MSTKGTFHYYLRRIPGKLEESNSVGKSYGKGTVSRGQFLRNYKVVEYSSVQYTVYSAPFVLHTVI